MIQARYHTDGLPHEDNGNFNFMYIPAHVIARDDTDNSAEVNVNFDAYSGSDVTSFYLVEQEVECTDSEQSQDTLNSSKSNSEIEVRKTIYSYVINSIVIILL